MQIEDIRSISTGSLNTSEDTSRLSMANIADQLQEKKSGEVASAIYGGDFAVQVKNPGYDKDSIKDETLAEKLSRESNNFSDAQTMKQNLSMAVAGFSVEDLKGMKEAGYDAEELEGNEFISVLDKIKMHLAMGGKDISMMGGLSKEDISKISGGSVSLEETIKSAVNAADLPAEDNVDEIAGAIQKAGEVEPTLDGGILNESTQEYLLRGELEPTIENIHTAAFSGNTASLPKANLSNADIEEMMPQIEGIVDEANMSFDDTQKSNALWMLEKQIPLTPENFSYLTEMQNSPIDLSTDNVLANITVSLAEGKSASEAYLMEGYSLKDKAEKVSDIISNATEEQVRAVVQSEKELTAENLGIEAIRQEQGLESKVNLSVEMSRVEVHAMRVLEETRMIMTQEANLSLMKQGITVDTTELSDLIEQLKNLEESFYKNTLVGYNEEITEEQLNVRIETFEGTNTAVEQLKEMPAVLLGKMPNVSDATISEINEQGASLSERFKAAGERYETMRTEVRRDLGDSIKKAFRNVDDILEDLDVEVTEASRRAVRILAYNQTEINVDSINRMKDSDEMVQRVIKDLTPPVVAKMIKEGINPLDLSMSELEEKTQEIKAVTASDSSEDNFAEFLYKAQNTGEIKDEERDAYIGIYRLIYQVEKTDGAVIGHLLNQGSELTLRNMMMASRSRKAENREYEVSDDFGFTEFDKSVLSITDQIEMSFMTKRMKDAGDVISPDKMRRFENEDAYLNLTPDAFAEKLENMEPTVTEQQAQRAYEKMTRDNIAEALKSEQRVYDFLEQYDMPTTPANLEAMAEMLNDRNGMYRKLFGMNKSKDREVFGTQDDGVVEGEVDLSDVIEDVIRRFGESVKTPEDMAEAQQKLEEIAENVMKDMLVEERVGSIDIRGMQVSMRQIKTVGEIGGKTETYAVPIVVEDSVGNLTLKIVRGSEENRGQVDMALDMESTGQMKATFKYDTGGVYGTVTSSLEQTSRRLREVIEELEGNISESSGVETHINIQTNRRTEANSIFYDDEYDFSRAENNERPEVQTRVLYGIARSFIDSVAKSFANGV